MLVSDFESSIVALEQREIDKAAKIFAQFSGDEWANELYEWKEEHAERVSFFIQELVKVLPADTPFDKVMDLVENYVLSLVHLPGAIDLAAVALVTFWNRCDNGDFQVLCDYLALLNDHPDGENVSEIASRIVPHSR